MKNLLVFVALVSMALVGCTEDAATFYAPQGSDSEFETYSDEESDSYVDTGTGSETGTGIDTGTGSDTGIDTGTGTGSDTGTGIDTGIDTGTGSGIDTGTGADTSTERLPCPFVCGQAGGGCINGGGIPHREFYCDLEPIMVCCETKEVIEPTPCPYECATFKGWCEDHGGIVHSPEVYTCKTYETCCEVPQVDTGTGVDTGSETVDTGTGVDTGSETVDTGSATVDTGSTIDTGSATVDTGTGVDTGSVIDTGSTVDTGSATVDTGSVDTGFDTNTLWDTTPDTDLTCADLGMAPGVPSRLCGNNGSCVDSSNGMACVCFEGYAGDDCSVCSADADVDDGDGGCYVEVVQQHSALRWLRCPLGWIWTGARCLVRDGTQNKSWSDSLTACPAGYRTPTIDETEDLVPCMYYPSQNPVNEYTCTKCEVTDRCVAMFGSLNSVYWFWTSSWDIGPRGELGLAWLANGPQLSLVAQWLPRPVRCMRTVP